MSQLATIGDVAALGGVPVDADDDEVVTRAERLIELASGQVLVYFAGFDITEASIGDWEDWRKDALAAVVAEIASKRLNVSAAASTDPYSTPMGGPETIKLNRWEKRALRDLVPPDEDDALEWVKP